MTNESSESKRARQAMMLN